MSLATGARLGPYEILAPIGAGGMGDVYKARDTRLDRLVAIKICREAFPDRFAREARAIAQLNHPHICQLYDVGPDYLVMEYVDGAPLQGPMPVAEALACVQQVCDALEAAHGRGIVHRDLKPANILATAAGVKLLDFGVARVAAATGPEDATQARAVTDAGTIVGTAAYMSPEQAEGRPVDARSDLFSLGVVLYELLSGRRPFDGPSTVAILAAVLRSEPAPLDAPDRVRTLVERCLRKPADERFQSAAELREALALVAGAPGDTRPSVAVLPFANMSADPENAFFSDGLSEEIINALTTQPGLRVIARTSAFRFRGAQDLRAVGAALGVGAVLDGSVRKAGTRLRISAQLIDVRDESHLWSERFDRELTDVFDVQDEIATAIAGHLQASLGRPAPEPAPRARPTRQVEAFETLLEGRHHWNRFTPAGAQRALACYQRALAIDPEYTDALVDLALYESVMGWMFADPRESLRRMNALAGRALALEPDHGGALGALAFGVVWGEWDWREADRLFRRAIALAPGSSNNVGLYGVLCCLGQGRCEEARTRIQEAMALDPLAGRVTSLYGRVLTCERRFEEADAWLRRALTLDPAQLLIVIDLAWALALQGKTGEALAIVQAAIDTHGRIKALMPVAGFVHAAAGRREEALRLLPGREPPGPGAYETPFTAVAVHAALGDLDAAFTWADRSLDERDPMMLYLAVHPVFDPLRPDPRYQRLLQRARLG